MADEGIVQRPGIHLARAIQDLFKTEALRHHLLKHSRFFKTPQKSQHIKLGAHGTFYPSKGISTQEGLELFQVDQKLFGPHGKTPS